MSMEKIIEIIKQKGPVKPAQIARELKTTILIASAYLADLSEKKIIQASSIKIGGFPIYFVEGQEEKLQFFMDKLPDKEKEFCHLLADKKVLCDSELDLSQRQIAEKLKDFAVQIVITKNNKQEKAWKWYLVNDEELKILEIEKAKDVKKIVKAILSNSLEKKTGDSSKIFDELKIQKIDATEKTEKSKNDTPEKTEKSKKYENPEKNGKIIKEKTQKFYFFIKIKQYFRSNSMEVVEKNLVKKNSEADFIIKVPSAVGTVSYYCKAKSKKSCSDLDLSSAFVQGQIRKLPVLFLTTGELSKKAKNLLSNPEFQNVQVMKI